MKCYDFSATAIFGMVLARIEVVNHREQLSVRQVVIDSRGSLYELFRVIGHDHAYPCRAEPVFVDRERLVQGLTLERTLERAISEEKELLKTWRVHNRRPSQEINGLKTVADQLCL